MHAKCLIADDTVFVGSFNFSHSGEENAENVLEIESPTLADTFSAYVDGLVERYRLTAGHVQGAHRPTTWDPSCSF